MKSCLNCNHSAWPTEEEGQTIVECRLNPPTVSETLLERYEKLNSLEHAIALATIYPVVFEDCVCSKWEGR